MKSQGFSKPENCRLHLKMTQFYINCLFTINLMSVQPPGRILNSVLEDQEQSSHTVSQANASSLLPPIGSTTSLTSRRRSLSRKNSFGISSIPALTQSVITTSTPLDTIQSVPENTLNPTVGKDRPVSRSGAISLDSPTKEDNCIQIESKVEAVVHQGYKKYNVPESTRSQSFIRKDVGLSSVGSYDPYTDSWKEKRHSISWSRSNTERFLKSKDQSSLGPGSYNASYDYIHPQNTLNAGVVAFKTNDRNFKISNNPDIGPTTYSVEIVKRSQGFVPWVKQVQTSLSRVIDFKNPISPTPHIQLIAQFVDSPILKSKVTVILFYFILGKRCILIIPVVYIS